MNFPFKMVPFQGTCQFSGGRTFLCMLLCQLHSQKGFQYFIWLYLLDFNVNNKSQVTNCTAVYTKLYSSSKKSPKTRSPPKTNISWNLKIPCWTLEKGEISTQTTNVFQIQPLHSLKLTYEFGGWEITFLLGNPIFRCELLVSGRVVFGGLRSDIKVLKLTPSGGFSATPGGRTRSAESARAIYIRWYKSMHRILQ